MISKIVIAVQTAIIVALVAVQFYPHPAKVAQVQTLPTTVGHWKNPNKQTSVSPIGHLLRVEDEVGFPNEAELKKITHDSLKTKAADGQETGDW